MAFLRNLSFYLRAGMPLLRALALHGDARRANGALLAKLIAESISNGHSLSSSLARFPRAFGALECGIIAAGEASGALPEYLEQLARMLDRWSRLRASAKAALLYPMIVLAGALGVAAFIVLYALPRIIPIFAGVHERLPLSTRLLLSCYWMLQRDWPFMCLAVAGVAAIGTWAWRAGRLRRPAERVLLVLPVARTIVRQC